MPADSPPEERLLVAVIRDSISLKEEIISAVDDELVDGTLVPGLVLETEEIGVEMFVIVHLF
jgi:hypothetical protein